MTKGEAFQLLRALKPRPRACGVAVLALVTAWSLAQPANAATIAKATQSNTQSTEDPRDLTDLTLEQLMDISIVSVSRGERGLFESAAAVHVLTTDDIRRSGVTTIPEALRLIPGMHVARIDINKWAISARGFNSRFANKLLVLIDGRSVYSPLFSGVFWDVQDTLIQDVEQIEVVLGPGATLWGANAVNGIINIITRTAHDTQGGLVVADLGPDERAGGFRYGGSTGTNGAWRVYAKGFDRDGTQFDSIESGPDPDLLDGDHHDSPSTSPNHWHSVRAGFRIDVDNPASWSWQVQGDYYRESSGSVVTVPLLTPPYQDRYADDTDAGGGNLFARAAREVRGSEVTLQFYYDRSDRFDSLYGERRDTLDFEVQQELVLGNRNRMVWGGGYRASFDRLRGGPTILFVDSERRTDLLNLFVQDDFAIVPERLWLVLGTKVEHNDYTDWEVQPNVRFYWALADAQGIWGSVARAARTPSRVERTATVDAFVIPPNALSNPTPLPTVFRVVPGENFGSENLLALELGYRAQVTPELRFDISAFRNRYDDLRSTEPGTPVLQPTHLILPAPFANADEVESYGVEASVDWKPINRARLRAWYSYMDAQYSNGSAAVQIPQAIDGGLTSALQDPGHPDATANHQGLFWASVDVNHKLEADVWIRYVDELAFLGIDSYWSTNVRVGWKLLPQLELSVAAENLANGAHREFAAEFLALSAISDRTGRVRLIWDF